MTTTSNPLEIRVRALEFILARLLADTRSSSELKIDREELQQIAQEGANKWLLVDVAPAASREILFAAISILEEAEFQQGEPT